jgi:hypothetical protein
MKSRSRLPWLKLARITGAGSLALLVVFVLGLASSEGQSGPAVWLSVAVLVVFGTVVARVYLAVRQSGASLTRAIIVAIASIGLILGVPGGLLVLYIELASQ